MNILKKKMSLISISEIIDSKRLGYLNTQLVLKKNIAFKKFFGCNNLLIQINVLNASFRWLFRIIVLDYCSKWLFPMPISDDFSGWLFGLILFGLLSISDDYSEWVYRPEEAKWKWGLNHLLFKRWFCSWTTPT